MRDKKYLVKVYKSGVYVGVLPYVVDDYTWTQDINTAGSEITIKLATDLKSAGITTSVDYLIDQSGNHITDQSGNRIITRQDFIFGTVPVDLGNGLDLWLYYSGNNNAGQRLFSGIVTSWEEDEVEGTITVTALSWGVQLDNYPIAVLPGSTVLSYPSYNQTDLVYMNDTKNGPYNRTVAAGQTFQVLSSTSIAAVSVWLGNSSGNAVTATLQLYAGTPGSTGLLLGTSSHAIASGSAVARTTMTLIRPVPVTAGTTYCWQVTVSAGVDYALSVGRDSTGSYATGQGYTYNDTSASWSISAGDYAFDIITASVSIGNQFNSFDPSAIITSLLDSFNNAGGIVSYTGSSVDTTGTVTSYTFKYNSVLDGIKKCLELAPPSWYWYVDLGTNILHFHKYTLTPDHIFVKGQHIATGKLKYSIELIKNRVIFSGGDDGTGVNIVSDQSNSSSISKYGQWLEFDSDSRVTLQNTADLIVNNTLGEYAKPQFSKQQRILAEKYDIETIHIGQMAGFRNSNDLTNSLVLQIVSLSKTPDYVDLTLATLPPDQTHRIEDIKRNLDNLITANNPAQ